MGGGGSDGEKIRARFLSLSGAGGFALHANGPIMSVDFHSRKKRSVPSYKLLLFIYFNDRRLRFLGFGFFFSSLQNARLRACVCVCCLHRTDRTGRTVNGEKKMKKTQEKKPEVHSILKKKNERS